jgi:lactobin A/cerein 7B family class IIb bacteriocin
MMAVMNNEVIEPAFPVGSATALLAEHHRARDLNERELDEVAGGVANLVTGSSLALLGGVAAGLEYAGSTFVPGGFSWRTFAATTISATVTGFLVGSGGALLFGASAGARVFGAGMVGAGYAMHTAKGVDSGSGGSDRSAE